MSWWCLNLCPCVDSHLQLSGARRGTWTPTPVSAADFESAMSAIPPFGHINGHDIMYFRRNQAGSPFYTFMHIGILVVNNLPSRQMGVLVGLTQRIDFCAATNLMGSNWKTTMLYGITLFYDYKENFLTERISTSNHLLFRGDCSYIYWHTVILSGCSSHSIYHSSFDNSVVVMTLQV